MYWQTVKSSRNRQTDKIEFLKHKGYCFGCLTQGHLSKDCINRLTCQVCSLKHPSILHMQKQEKAKEGKNSTSEAQITSAVGQETCGYTGAGNGECVLAIVPVRLKSKKGTQTVETYSFIDQGSSATFCTEKVMTMLNLRGRKTEILLRTMGQEKLVHGVYHPKNKKIRVVFDCTATYQGVSLNNQLLQGPDLTNTLIGVLTMFREEPVAMMADIEAMFYQVRVPAKDSDFLRFLWWPEGDLAGELKEYRMTVHIFGATSSPSCACFALRKTTQDGRNKTTAEAAKTVERNFYMDDCDNCSLRRTGNSAFTISKSCMHGRWI